MAADSVLGSLKRNGFVIIRGAVTGRDLEKLRTAAAYSTTLARVGKWPYVRTLPKQFPPWPESTLDQPPAEGIWGVQGLLHPDMPGTDTFAALYFSDAILGTTCELLQCGKDELVMELLNLLVRPDADFALRWHRDDVRWEAAAKEEEIALLPGRTGRWWSAQWNLALEDDASLEVVPGSHARARTASERAANPLGSREDMPGAVTVDLRAGDVVFYDNNILHRGAYSAARERLTVHGSAGHAAGGGARARNVLQHGGREWVERCDFACLDEKARATAEGMRERLVRLGREHENVGYSLEG